MYTRSFKKYVAAPLLAALLSVIVTPASSQAQTIYSTSFEAPTHSTTGTIPLFIPPSLGGGSFTSVPGSIFYGSGQGDPWGLIYTSGATATNFKAAADSLTIQNSVVAPSGGSQALKVDGFVANQGSFGAMKNLNVAMGSVVDLQFAMRVDNAGAQVGQWGLALYNELGESLASVGFYGGYLVAGSGLTIYSPLSGEIMPVNYFGWNTYRLKVDFVAKTLSVALNGTPISGFQDKALRNDIPLTGKQLIVGLGGQTPIGSGYSSVQERGYFDRFSAGVAPEPGTLALLTLGGTLVVVRRRRTAK